ncbi:MAG: sigma-54-dependent Fis family transcriptional regulator [Fimbriimonadaceae bacterium]|nr:sigma-54-dependent Fis family transcriptional regulator [Chitinophagales bacterium]
MRNVLIIDDEATLRSLLSRIISLEGFHVFEVSDAKQAFKILAKENIQAVISDVKLPDANGVELTKEIKLKYPALEIIVITAFGTIDDGVQAIKNGAFDYLTKGDHNHKILPLLNKAIDKAVLQQKIETLEKTIQQKFGFEKITGSSKQIKECIMLAQKVAQTDTTVLLTGETGTGKEIFAQAIHYESLRKSKNFIAVNCSALSKEILESELFGYKEGAFTGAQKDKKGLFEEANDGTIFLDEIGEMPLDLQAKILRVLENGTFIKVGETKETKTNVRLIAATNRNLTEEIDKNNFRLDLFYRLSVFQIQLPALKERKEDIEQLAHHFMLLFAKNTNKKIATMSAEFITLLRNHPWKGNIRELKNIIERAIILCDTNALDAHLLPYDFTSQDGDSKISEFDLQNVEKNHVKKVLAYTKGNKAETARLLNIGLSTLYRKMEEYKLQ